MGTSSGGIGGGGGSRIPEGLSQSGAGQVPGQIPEGGQPPAEGAQFGNAQVAADGSVTVDGVAVDLNTPEGAAALMAAVDPEQLAQIKSMLNLKQVEGVDGPILVPDDSYKKVDVAGLKKAQGPMSADGGDELDKELGTWFAGETGVNPHNANTTPTVTKNLKSDPNSGFGTAVSSVTQAYENPTQQNINTAAADCAKVAYYPTAGTINIHEILFSVFRESIQETNEDKKYFLAKLQMYNDMGEQLSGYLSELVDHSRELGVKAAGMKYPEMCLTPRPVEIKQYDLSTLDPNGQLMETDSKSERLDRNGLSNTIKEVESMQETVRNERQMASTAFQNFDQKANQLYNLLSSVMKAMSEMRMGTVRNML